MTLAPTTGLLHDLDTREGCISAASSAIKDYRGTMLLVVESWVKNEFGTVHQLAEAIGRKKRSLDKYQTELRQQGRLPQSPFARDQGARKSAPSVENVEVEVLEPIQAMTDQEAAAFNDLVDLCTEQEQTIEELQAAQTTTPASNNVRHHGQQPGDPGHLDSTLSEHWQHVCDSDEPESWKQAQYLLSQFELQLQRGLRDGWSESAYDSLRIDLEGYATACFNSSRGHRARLDEAAQAVRERLQSAVSGGEG